LHRNTSTLNFLAVSLHHSTQSPPDWTHHRFLDEASEWTTHVLSRLRLTLVHTGRFGGGVARFSRKWRSPPRFARFSRKPLSVFVPFYCGWVLRQGEGLGMEMENLTQSGGPSLLWSTCREREQAQSFHWVLGMEASLTVGVVVTVCLLAAFFGLRKPFRRRVPTKTTARRARWFGVVDRSLSFCSTSLRLSSPFSVGLGRSSQTRYALDGFWLQPRCVITSSIGSLSASSLLSLLTAVYRVVCG